MEVVEGRGIPTDRSRVADDRRGEKIPQWVVAWPAGLDCRERERKREREPKRVGRRNLPTLKLDFPKP